MDDAAVAQARQRVMHWIEESREVFGLMPEVLLGSKADEAEKLARELPDGAAAGFFGRPDLKADLQEISRGLKEAGRDDEAAKVSTWIP